MNKYQEALDRMSKFEYVIFITQRERSVDYDLLAKDKALLQELIDKTIPQSMTYDGKNLRCPKCGMWVLSEHIKVCPSYECLQALKKPEVTK